jgi:tetratricopeptide (TPR) repeat protein
MTSSSSWLDGVEPMRLLVPRQRCQVKHLPAMGSHPVVRPMRSAALGHTLTPRVVRMALGRAALWLLLANTACRLQPPAVERAALLAEHGQAQQAIDVLVEHLQAEPADIPARQQLVRLYGSVGRIDEATAQTERLVELLPRDSPVPPVELGHALELAHRYDEALAEYDRAARVAPTSALGPKTAGERAAHWGELELAEPRLAEAVRREPRDAGSWHMLGLVRLGLGRLEPAREAYRSGLRADPAALENRLGLATVALRANEPAAALEQYESLLQARPTFTDALLGKSWSLILLGRFAAAEAELARAEALGADPKSVARQRVALQERKGRAP